MSQHQSFTIGQVARLTGFSAKVIRYYESIGLLPAPLRGENGYRFYGMADVHRLRLLRRIRLLGVPLAEAKTLLLETSQARCAQVQRDLLGLVEQRLHAIDQELQKLRQLRVTVERYQQSLVACHPDTTETFATCSDLSCLALADTYTPKEEPIPMLHLLSRPAAGACSCNDGPCDCPCDETCDCPCPCCA